MARELLPRLLSFYGLTAEEFENEIAAPLARLSFPSWPVSEYHKKAKETVLRAIESQKKILLYGDYDVDGIASTAIANNALKELGADVKAFLPSRYVDGYGLNVANVEKIARNGYGLIICLDNGIVAYEAIERARSLGLEVVVIDHHELGEKLPECEGIVHYKVDRYPEPQVSAGYTAYFFFKELLGHDDPYLMHLGALSTLSDMMPLRKHNRLLVRLSFEEMKRQPMEELRLLTKKDWPDAEDLSMRAIPALNAIGRLKGSKELALAIRFFDKDETRKEDIAKYLLALNDERKAKVKEVADQMTVEAGEAALVFMNPGIEGIGGQLASRLTDDYGVPSCVFSKAQAHPGCLVGSFRAPEGMDILEILLATDMEFLAIGGHAGAAGATIKEEDFGKFSESFKKAAAEVSKKPVAEKSIAINYDEINLDNCRLVKSLEPFGKGFPKPLFSLAPLLADEFRYAKQGMYLSFTIPGGGKVFSFRYGEKDFDINNSYSFSGYLKADEFNGRQSATFYVEKVSPAR